MIEPHEISILSYAGPDRSISREAIASAQLFKARRYRNRRLGDFLKELDFTEGRSTGIPTIQDELRKNGSPAATVETDHDRSYFLITLPVHPDFKGEPVIVQHEQINDLINEHINVQDEQKECNNYCCNNELSIENEQKEHSTGQNRHKSEQITERQQAILSALLGNNSATYETLAAATLLSVSTIRREMQMLIQYGLIQRIGTRKSGKWVIVRSK